MTRGKSKTYTRETDLKEILAFASCKNGLPSSFQPSKPFGSSALEEYDPRPRPRTEDLYRRIATPRHH
jgi:hypothetical protein